MRIIFYTFVISTLMFSCAGNKAIGFDKITESIIICDDSKGKISKLSIVTFNERVELSIPKEYIKANKIPFEYIKDKYEAETGKSFKSGEVVKVINNSVFDATNSMVEIIIEGDSVVVNEQGC